jgi:prepilin-type N-terminal cleavage/methylation domain-containing protein
MISDINTRKQNCSRGFTLVEILVVIAILAILLTLVVVAINPAARINASKDAQALANVSQLGKSFEACINDRMTLAGRSAAGATDDCCGRATNDAGDCVSDATHGLALYNYGYAGGFPIMTHVNRGAAGTTGICIDERRGSDNNYVGFTVGGGTLNTASAGGCSNGVLLP